MTIDVMSFSGEIEEKIVLEPGIFCLENRPDVLKRVFEWQMCRKRLGNHNTKGISDISGTTAKPYRQKHTGRARQGSLRSPQFRGGAVIFGPKVRSYEHSLNKKIRNLGLKVALSLKKTNNQLIIVDNLDHKIKKTKDLLKVLNVLNYKSYLLIGSSAEEIKLSSRNLYNVKLIPENAINVVDILSYQCTILTVSAVKYLEGRLL